MTEGADTGLIINMSPLFYCRAHTIPVIYAQLHSHDPTSLSLITVGAVARGALPAELALSRAPCAGDHDGAV